MSHLSIITQYDMSHTVDNITNFINYIECIPNKIIDVYILQIYADSLLNIEDINIKDNINIYIIKSGLKDSTKVNINKLRNIAIERCKSITILFTKLDCFFTDLFYQFVFTNQLPDDIFYIGRTLITYDLNDIVNSIIGIKDIDENYEVKNILQDIQNNVDALEFENEHLYNNKNIFLNGAENFLLMSKKSWNKLTGFPVSMHNNSTDIVLYNAITKGFNQVILPFCICCTQLKPSNHQHTFTKAHFINIEYKNDATTDVSYEFYASDTNKWTNYRNPSKVFKGYKPEFLLKENEELKVKMKQLEKIPDVLTTNSEDLTTNNNKILYLQSKLDEYQHELAKYTDLIRKTDDKINKIKQIEELKKEIID